MDFNEQVDGVQVCTLRMKTNNMFEIQNNRVVDVRLKESFDMFIHCMKQVWKDIVGSTVSSARHDGFMTKGDQDKCKEVQETLAKLVERVGPMTVVLLGHERNEGGVLALVRQRHKRESIVFTYSL